MIHPGKFKSACCYHYSSVLRLPNDITRAYLERISELPMGLLAKLPKQVFENSLDLFKSDFRRKNKSCTCGGQKHPYQRVDMQIPRISSLLETVIRSSY